MEEIDAFVRSMKNCPKCRSTEGFWLAANRTKSYVQCKHCGAILEILEVFPHEEKTKSSKFSFKLKW